MRLPKLVRESSTATRVNEETDESPFKKTMIFITCLIVIVEWLEMQTRSHPK